jgi:hypothetical protein
MALQAALSVMTSTFLVTDSVYDEHSLEGLRELASRCPYVDGNGVYMARTMLSRLDTVAWFIAHPCEFVPMPPSARLAETDSEEELTVSNGMDEFALYPNPSSERFTLTFPALSGNATVRLSDLSGRVHRIISVDGGAGKTDLIPSLSNGVYILSLEDSEGGAVWTTRLVQISP